MSALAVSLFQVLSCVGLGAAILSALGISNSFSFPERVAYGFAIGVGCLGWIIFFLGIAGGISELWLYTVLIVGTAGSFFLFSPETTGSTSNSGGWRPGSFDWLLIVAIICAMGFDLAEGVAPPADADSLWYHFTIPRQFVEAGRIIFIPRAIDGAVPLLMQTTYVLPLALGGEQPMTLWTAYSGWGAAALLFLCCRRYLSTTWSLAVTVLFLTTPAVVYGAGSGQVEVRNAMFVIVAADAVARARETGQLRFALLAGFCAGFFVAAKYLGLLFAAACGLILLWHKSFIRLAATFSLGVLVAGSQWYVWNWIHTGDPVFPLLFPFIGDNGQGIWDVRHHERIQQEFFIGEKAVPVNPFWYFAYPFIAMFTRVQQIESGKTGLGPFLILILPFSIAAAWQFRERVRASRLLSWALLAILFYTLWFFVGSSHRIRHLLPIYPLLLLCAFVASAYWSEATNNRGLLVVAVLFTLGLQLVGHSLFTISYAQRILTGQTQSEFLARNVVYGGVALWINQNLSVENKVFIAERQLIYLVDVPVFSAHRYHQALVDILPDTMNTARFVMQLRDIGVDHLLVRNWPTQAPQVRGGFRAMSWELVNKGCARIVKQFSEATYASRTLPAINTYAVSLVLLRLEPGEC